MTKDALPKKKMSVGERAHTGAKLRRKIREKKKKPIGTVGEDRQTKGANSIARLEKNQTYWGAPQKMRREKRKGTETFGGNAKQNGGNEGKNSKESAKKARTTQIERSLGTKQKGRKGTVPR